MKIGIVVLGKLGLPIAFEIESKELNVNALIASMKGCKWPIGHPGDEDFYFCGKEVIPGKPYCGEHCLTAYRRKDNSQKIKKFFKLNTD